MADNDYAAINADADYFFSRQVGFSQTSPFGFAALSAVIGLFSEQAVLKLKQVAETIFFQPERATDATRQKDLNKPGSQPVQKPPNKPSSP